LEVRRWILIWAQAVLISGGGDAVPEEITEGPRSAVELRFYLGSHIYEAENGVKKRLCKEMEEIRGGVFFSENNGGQVEFS
jgi:hypothetical protein